MIQQGFFAWPIVAFFIVLYLLKQAGSKTKTLIYYVLGFTVWIAYIMLLERSSLLQDFSLPPKVPLFIVMPAVATILFITSRKFFKPLLQNTSLHLPVFLQSFRIVVELLIYGAFLKGILPKQATFEGMNFDIFVGFSALIMGLLLQTNKLGVKALMVWNIASLAVLGLTAYSIINTFYFTDFVKTTGNNSFVEIPYIFLVSVLLPTAIFLHVFSIRQVLQKKIV